MLRIAVYKARHTRGSTLRSLQFANSFGAHTFRDSVTLPNAGAASVQWRVSEVVKALGPLN